MTVFVVERYLVGWSPEEMRDLVATVADRAPHFRTHGVRHLRSIVIVEDETCLCLFDGPDAGEVARANSDLPVDRIVAAEQMEAV